MQPWLITYFLILDIHVTVNWHLSNEGIHYQYHMTILPVQVLSSSRLCLWNFYSKWVTTWSVALTIHYSEQRRNSRPFMTPILENSMVFSRSWWIDSVEASSHCQYCKQLCGRMEIPCWMTFTCSRKATLNQLKALLKVLIYANLRHGVQMFSQMSRIPDLIRKFWAKRCGLYAGV